MGNKLDIFRAAAGVDVEESKKEKSKTNVSEIVQISKDIANTENIKKKTKVLAIEVIEEDLPKFDQAMIKLSSRDGTLYKRKDIYIAMTKYFFDAIDKNIDKIKLEKY